MNENTTPQTVADSGAANNIVAPLVAAPVAAAPVVTAPVVATPVVAPAAPKRLGRKVGSVSFATVNLGQLVAILGANATVPLSRKFLEQRGITGISAYAGAVYASVAPTPVPATPAPATAAPSPAPVASATATPQVQIATEDFDKKS